jgi:hypothetical protein
LQFRYEIAAGDSAIPLEYNNTRALSGDLRRYSSNDASLESILTLPPAYTKGSLGFCCNVSFIYLLIYLFNIN